MAGGQPGGCVGEPKPVVYYYLSDCLNKLLVLCGGSRHHHGLVGCDTFAAAALREIAAASSLYERAEARAATALPLAQRSATTAGLETVAVFPFIQSSVPLLLYVPRIFGLYVPKWSACFC